ncbi:MAG: TrmH family RNA methyltransferase [Muribaculaceae bacterium]|nr:TrmH family RNA methyltransferase [Muribaculaceae bacterium]
MQKKNIVELTRIDVEGYKKINKCPLSLMADNVRSMQNIGALFRTADAFLIREIILGGISGVPPHPEISKSALGADESVNWRYVEDTYMEVSRLKEQGWKIYILEQTHDSVSLQNMNVDFNENNLLVVGNEVEGVDQRIADMADVALEIPQEGIKHSLNVSVSAGIAMWEFYKNYLKVKK